MVDYLKPSPHSVTGEQIVERVVSDPGGSRGDEALIPAMTINTTQPAGWQPYHRSLERRGYASAIRERPQPGVRGIHHRHHLL